jgi:hypothetical protein
MPTMISSREDSMLNSCPAEGPWDRPSRTLICKRRARPRARGKGPYRRFATESLVPHNGTIGPVGLAGWPWAGRPRLADPVSMTTTIDPIPAGPVHPAEHREPSSSSGPRQRTVLGFVATRRIVEVILAIILGVGSGLLFFGSHFGLNMVHTQLAAQNISFPAKGSSALSPAEFPDLQRYAGQKVDNGPKAKAYADGFIRRHLASVAGGKTYSQVSTAAQANPNDATLAAQVNTLFKGETLRGLLLYAWGWSVVSTIALYAAIGALIGFVIMLGVTIGDFVADPKIAAHQVATA